MTLTENLRHLILELEAEIEHFRQLANDVTESTTQFSAREHIPIHDLRGIAMLLTEIYSGTENLMLRVAKSLAEPIPSGKNWHKELLEQFSAEMPDTRPALFRQSTVRKLDEFRRFRHVTHHIYSFDYDWQQMRRLLTLSNTLLVELREDAEKFKSFLMNIVDDKDDYN